MTRAIAELERLDEDARRERNWKRWGPYLAARQWATVREDYSVDGESWLSFPHDQARSRAYRWGEDGLLGFCDRECRLCVAVALWNERDPILKERLFGLTGKEGNHGEDVKEHAFFLDGTPTHSYMRALYRYPQHEFPYDRLVAENRARGRDAPEYELEDTGVFAEDRYFDVVVELAKAAPDDLLITLTAHNRGPAAAPLHLLPTVWFRNTWSWGPAGEEDWPRPSLVRVGAAGLLADHASLGAFRFEVDAPQGALRDLLFTENETNRTRLEGRPSASPYVKDAFHEHVVHGRPGVVNLGGTGTKAAAHCRFEVPAGGTVTVRCRLAPELAPAPFGAEFEAVRAARAREADELYGGLGCARLAPEHVRIMRQAYAGLLWSKQFYYYVVGPWLDGDPAAPAPPARAVSPNREWRHLHCRDVLSVPDAWEYPWFAAWDLAFHMIPFARLDPHFAKEQLVLLLREWYMHPNGQLPAYEFNFGDVNPPVHAWAAWRVYKITGARGQRDRLFLERVFQKLLMNFTWWVNRKDPAGQNLFAGGFLGLDNIGVFDRSRPIAGGGYLAQADGTAWMAFYCAEMLAMALELAPDNPAYEDLASKFFEHFVAITDAMNRLGGTGLWHEEDGFYYDQIVRPGGTTPLRVRSMVGIIPLFAALNIEDATLEALPGFARRTRWFLRHREDLARHIACLQPGARRDHGHRLLAIPSRARLVRVLRYVLDEQELLSPFGVRSLSRAHAAAPFVLAADGQELRVGYVPGESDSGLFGGNSNWRGPVWFPLNYLLVEALEQYHHFYGDTLKVECPTGSGTWLDLGQVAAFLARRLVTLFLPGPDGRRPCDGAAAPGEGLLRFHEYFDGDTGRGCGASCQGWTALVVRFLEDLARRAAVPDLAAPECNTETRGHGDAPRS
ncbi:MAG TPA: glucosidase [Polyangia bacterium]